MATTQQLSHEFELEQLTESVLHRLATGEWQFWSGHCSGNAPRSWDKWSDPQEWDVPIPTLDDILRVGNCTASDGMEVAVAIVSDAALRMLYEIRDADYPETPDSAIDDLAVTICTPDGEPVID